MLYTGSEISIIEMVLLILSIALVIFALWFVVDGFISNGDEEE